MSLVTLIEHLGEVEDPRCGGKVGHRLGDILVIAVCAVIACAERTGSLCHTLGGTTDKGRQGRSYIVRTWCTGTRVERKL